MNDWHAAVAVSLLVHGVVFYGDVGVSSQPSLNVRQAPSSIEISLVSAHVEVKKELNEIREVARESVKPEPRPVVKEKVIPQKEKKQQKEEKEKVAINTQQGALSNAEPLSFENEAPKYPRVARERGYEGEVMLEVQVLQDGRAGSVSIKESSGYFILDKAAVKAVRRWQFTPAMRGETIFTSAIELPIVFRLRDSR